MAEAPALPKPKGKHRFVMLNQILMVFSIACCLVGAFLLFGLSTTSDELLLGGGAMLSIGLILATSSFRTWLKWREYKKTSVANYGESFRPQESADATESPALKPLSHHQAQERRRSHRMMLHILVLVEMDTPEGKHLQAQAFTAWVNAHGGLVECPIRIPPGQEITLVNPQSGKKVRCRVLQAQRASEDSFAISFEFYAPSPLFWPVASPPLSWRT